MIVIVPYKAEWPSEFAAIAAGPGPDVEPV